jgi:hypothetical protein
MSTLGDFGPPLLPLRGRSLFDASGDGPHVPRWIHNPPGMIAPELVLHWKHDLRPGGYRPLYHFVHVLDVDEDHDRRTAVRLRGTARKGWPLSFDDDHCPADRLQRMGNGSIWARSRPSSTAPNAVLQKSIAAATSRHTNIGITTEELSGIGFTMLIIVSSQAQVFVPPNH